MLDGYFVQTVTKIVSKRNAYGDIVAAGGTVKINCRFRFIGEMDQINNREEQRGNLAMVWFPPSTDINFNDVILYQGVHYKITRRTDARRLGSTTVEFIKCTVSPYDMIS